MAIMSHQCPTHLKDATLGQFCPCKQALTLQVEQGASWEQVCSSKQDCQVPGQEAAQVRPRGPTVRCMGLCGHEWAAQRTCLQGNASGLLEAGQAAESDLGVPC